MKTLYLVRHAKSGWDKKFLEDFERPLNRRGKNDALMMGRVLREREVRPDIIITSPAARAAATTRWIARELGYHPERILYDERLYEADEDDFRRVIADITDSYDSAMVVSHNPGIMEFAESVTGEELENVPTGGVVAIEYATESWREAREQKGSLRFFEFPKKHKQPESELDDSESEDGESDNDAS